MERVERPAAPARQGPVRRRRPAAGGTLHAAFVRSPHGHARVTRVDVEAARALPGVHAVYVAADVESLGPVVGALPRDDVHANARPILAADRVRFAGEPVAMVVATSRYVAEDAVRLVEVDYEPLPAVVDPEAALAPGAPQLHDDIPGNSFLRASEEHGDVEGAFARADRVVRKRFHYGRVHALPLEGRAILASWDAGEEELTLWLSSQVPGLARTLMCHPLGLTEKQLRVIAPDVGGGFGLKIQVNPEELLAALASIRLGRPVKWVEDRYEALAASYHAKEVVMDLELAVMADGTFLAMRGRYVGDTGAYASSPFTGLVDPMCAAVLLPGIYRLEAVRWEIDCAFTNKCPTAAYRAVGWSSGQAAREALVDQAARELGIDPVELRLRNTIGDEPQVSPTGCAYDGGSYAASQRLALELVGWDGFRERQAAVRAEGRLLGLGVSPFVEPGGWASAMAKRMGFPFDYLDASSVTVEPDGSVLVTTGLHAHGQGHRTVLAQVVADRLGVAFESVKVVQGDTDRTVYGTGSYGSRSAVVGFGSLARACDEVADKLKRIAAYNLEVAPEDIELVDGKAVVRGAPDRSIEMLMLGYTAYFGAFVGGKRPPDIDPYLTSTRSYDPPETYSNGCCAAIVEVDPETGVVRIDRLAFVDDCGVMLNPTLVEGQLAGASAQGIGAALYEELPYDEDGNFLAGTLLDYLYPTTLEIPPMALAHIETPSTVTEGGVKGAGEGGNVAAPSAIVNAVQDAIAHLGAEVTRTPLTPDRVRALLRG
ncbi:MAG: xanthine dehydrogenase family protein molybdopterin-binding subunit [Thermoleophilia bacterium]